MMASKTITNASSFKLSSFVQEIKVLNFSPIMPILPGIAKACNSAVQKKLKKVTTGSVSYDVYHTL